VAHEGVALHCVGNEAQLRSPEFQLFDQLRVCRISSSFKTLICLLAKMLGVWHGVLPDFIILAKKFSYVEDSISGPVVPQPANDCIVNVLRAALRECTYPVGKTKAQGGSYANRQNMASASRPFPGDGGDAGVA
jgi:hypothetical protein